MSKPSKGGEVVQLSTWIPVEDKERLAKLAAAEGKREKEVVGEAIKAHLDAKLPEEPFPQPA